MNEQDTNKVKVAIANSFLQTATVQQTLAILQEKALERANEEVENMSESNLEEVLTNIRAQEIAAELKAQSASEAEAESASSEEPEGSEETEVVAETSEKS